MIVISDTSPFCYLILIDCINILPQLYDKIIIPEVVYQELINQDSPQKVKEYLKNKPNWLLIKNHQKKADLELEKLDQGEKSAIILAEETKADLIILDEKLARKIAKNRNLKIIGLLGILYDGCLAGLIEVDKFKELEKTNFFVSPKLLESVIEKVIDYQKSNS
jgi:predicted nucleic acid-binding protein